MKSNLIRLAKADSLPLCKSTLYKWKHLGKFPQLFVKLGGALFVNLNVLDEIIEAGRLKESRGGLWTKPVSLGARAVGWPSDEVDAINSARIAGKSDEEIRTLVAKLEADRKVAK